MRSVLDTNVLVSGLLSPHGPPARLLDWTLGGALTLVVDDRVLSEYAEVLARPKFGFDSRDVGLLLRALQASAESVVAMPLAITLPDPFELPFLEVAHSAQADVLVTGNRRDFKPVNGKHAVKIQTPRDFVGAYGELQGR